MLTKNYYFAVNNYDAIFVTSRLLFVSKKPGEFIILSPSRVREKVGETLLAWSSLLGMFRIAAQEDHWLLGRIANGGGVHIHVCASEFDRSFGRCTVDGMVVARLITWRGNVWAVTNTRDQSCPNGAPKCIACNDGGSDVTARQTSCAESICPSALIIHRVCSMHSRDETLGAFDRVRLFADALSSFSISRVTLTLIPKSFAIAFK